MLNKLCVRVFFKFDYLKDIALTFDSYKLYVLKS